MDHIQKNIKIGLDRARALKLGLTLGSGVVIGLMSFNPSYAASRLQAMSDEQLSATVGQALMNLTYTAPTDAVNLESKRIGGDKNIGFYKMGMEADMELNANIRKLQLGCGGVNGPGCDLDIDYLSLSGVADSNTGRAASSAKISNPFLEFAIKNPDRAATREVVGLRASAEAIQGMLTFGLENGPNPSGINSLSGYMEVAAAGGKVNVNPINNLTYQSSGNTQIKGKVKGWLIPLDFTSTEYNLNITPTKQGDLRLPQQVITGKRINNAPLVATAYVNGLDLSGNIIAKAAGLNLNRKLSGSIDNLTVDVKINEGLGFFHKANLNGSAASLSLQSNDLRWPGSKSVAQNGWWLELSNPIDIGDITPTEHVTITTPTIKETLGEVSKYITANPISCGTWGLLQCVFGDSIDVKTVDLSKGTPVNLNLTNLELKNQNFAPNCYGNLKFC